jgi:hypothetical protein
LVSLTSNDIVQFKYISVKHLGHFISDDPGVQKEIDYCAILTLLMLIIAAFWKHIEKREIKLNHSY